MSDIKQKRFICNMCNYHTNNCNDYVTHTNTKKHQRNGKKTEHMCTVADCNYTTKSTWNLKMHYMTNHSSIEERKAHKYYCNACDKIYFSPLYLDNHLKSKIHSNYVKAQEDMKKNNDHV